MKIKQFLLVAIIFPIMWAAFQVGQARNVRNAVENAADAGDRVICNGREMTEAECRLAVIAKVNVSAVMYFLIGLGLANQWATIYVLLGLAGAVTSYWYLSLQGASPRDFGWDRIIFRLLLGCISGYICSL